MTEETEKRSCSVISLRFIRFKKAMHGIWESYELIDFYMPLVHGAIRQHDMPPLPLRKVASNAVNVLPKDKTYGCISRMHGKSNARRCLMDAVATYEYFLGDLCSRVYHDFPGRIDKSSGNESDGRQEKLIQMILQSESRQEIIDRVIEERVRGIFYGNPTDFFRKSKGDLGLAKTIPDDYPESLAQLIEIFARRNIGAHNDGRVDRKYLRETENSPFRLGEIPPTTTEYLREAIDLLIGFASLAAGASIQAVYHQPPGRQVARALLRFSKTRQ